MAAVCCVITEVLYYRIPGVGKEIMEDRPCMSLGLLRCRADYSKSRGFLPLRAHILWERAAIGFQSELYGCQSQTLTSCTNHLATASKESSLTQLTLPPRE